MPIRMDIIISNYLVICSILYTDKGIDRIENE